MKLNCFDLKVALFILPLVVLFSCKKENAAQKPLCYTQSIRLSDTGVRITGRTLQFKSTAIPSCSFMWDFGDGQTSTDSTPFHAYNDTGAYRVSLTLNNDLTSRVTIIVFINPNPVYTSQIAVNRQWSHKHYNYWSSGTTDTGMTTTKLSIIYIDPVTIAFPETYSSDTLSYDFRNSNDSLLVFDYSFTNPFLLPKSGNYSLVYNRNTHQVVFTEYINQSLGLETRDIYTSM